jgi:hypothetical protein
METPTAICAFDAAGIINVSAASSKNPSDLRVLIILTFQMQRFAWLLVCRARIGAPAFAIPYKPSLSRKVATLRECAAFMQLIGQPAYGGDLASARCLQIF